MNNKESGQTMVEYLLLSLVIVTIIYGVIKSDVFRNVVDIDGGVMEGLYRRMRYSYRHALPGNKKMNPRTDYNSTKHDSYLNPQTNFSRFFAPNAGYPRQ